MKSPITITFFMWIWKTSTSPMSPFTSWAKNSYPCTLCICRRWETDPTFSRNPAMCLNTMKTRPPIMKYPPRCWGSDEKFARLMEEADKYVGFPYVWGGSTPETSFDCSGFVSYVLTNSGLYNTGRLGAQGLYNISTPVSNPQPGDLVFFTGTYDTPAFPMWGFMWARTGTEAPSCCIVATLSSIQSWTPAIGNPTFTPTGG